MKSVIALLSLTLSYSVLACNQEAQFIGKVHSVRVNEKSECVFQVNNYKWFGPSYVCPLTPGEVSGAEFVDKNCSLKNGDEVSGVFVKIGDTFVID